MTDGPPDGARHTSAGDDGGRPGAEPRPTRCPHVCPLCMTLETFHTASPEVTEHLLRAGGELLLAMRAVLDAAGGVLREAEERSASSSGIESIPIQRD